MSDDDADALDTLARMLAEGKAKITAIRGNACGKCKEGTFRSQATPDWMNRLVCDKCGAEVPR